MFIHFVSDCNQRKGGIKWNTKITVSFDNPGKKRAEEKMRVGWQKTFCCSSSMVVNKIIIESYSVHKKYMTQHTYRLRWSFMNEIGIFGIVVVMLLFFTSFPGPALFNPMTSISQD